MKTVATFLLVFGICAAGAVALGAMTHEPEPPATIGDCTILPGGETRCPGDPR